ncbi:MAG: ABC transporter ATP-binding protein [Phycisphaeraceae bacterium]|nr:ABC transporter ATP-binding protein [Phycisphaerales bacterium]MCB9860664.1 ABC transporter ATP-binding protein [Phycisphaeraceae bacterium]
MSAVTAPNASQRTPALNGSSNAANPDMPQSASAQREIAIRVQGVSKCYHVYTKPVDRLKQAIYRWKKQCYKEFWALHEVDLTLYRGQTLGIIGRNGAGKSTLLQIICGTLRPTTGSVEVHGKISALLELGSGFNKDFTGRENVYLAGAIRGLSRKQIDSLLDSILSFADIGSFIDQPLHTYSSGMVVRLAFAVAAHVEPDILVVDEALSVGDIFFQQKCARYMRDKLANTTKLLVSHDLGSIAQHCDRAVVLSRGRLAFEGTPKDAIAYYTKIVHSEQRADSEATQQFTTNQDQFHRANSTQASLPWVPVTDEKRGGVGKARITRVAVTNFDLTPIGVLQPGDGYICHAEFETDEAMDQLIFGTLLQDRFGNAVCGDNTCSLEDPVTSVGCAGRHQVSLEFRWPEIRQGAYTLTFGIGQGDHPLYHDIQCWAHNVVEIKSASPRIAIHGLFNNHIRSMEVRTHG